MYTGCLWVVRHYLDVYPSACLLREYWKPGNIGRRWDSTKNSLTNKPLLSHQTGNILWRPENCWLTRRWVETHLQSLRMKR